MGSVTGKSPKLPRRVRLNLGAFGEDVVEVVGWVKGGRVLVRFDSGAELLLPDHHTRRLEIRA